jgi:1-deoxy-D-xylulose-5-phosphate synthase
MSLLERLAAPADLKALDAEQLPALAAEIREFLVQKVSKTGGHLGPNLGAVELTIGIHRVFDSPLDRIIWDTGHQAYVHKVLTGRTAGFDELRQPGGLSGYPSRAESEHDFVENSHASTALSYADGIAKGLKLRGETHSVVAVVGDGALTGGMCWEELNNIAASKDLRIVIVVNDNGRSYAPTIGGLAAHLAHLRTTQSYEAALSTVKSALVRTPVVGQPIYGALHGMKKGIKDLIQPQMMFEDLGLKYVGPIDGHNIASVESALSQARDFHGPVIVHCVTRKGYGYQPAIDDEADCLHQVSAPGAAAGSATAQPSWTSVFGEEIVAIGAENPRVVALTAAMLQPVGLQRFQDAFPDRTFDVGIAEQHAVTSAAGMAMAGMHPVVSLYSTFLNRAFDQVLMDVALHDLPVTFTLDRAGITGQDGPSHNGMWDLAMLSIVPKLAVAAPRDATRLRSALRQSIVLNGPSAVRYYGKLPSGTDLEPVRSLGPVDVLHETAGAEVLIVSVGPLADRCIEAARLAEAEDVRVTVADPTWCLPVPAELVQLAARHKVVVTVEDGLRVGGVGSRVDLALRDAGVEVPTITVGVRQEFVEMGERDAILRDMGLSPQHIARTAVAALASHTDGEPASSATQIP